MTTTSFPFEGQTTTESQFSHLFSELQDTGVVDSADSASLLVTGNSSGMQVSVNAGSAIVRGFMFESDAITTLPIDASGSVTRYDRVVLRLDPAANNITLDVLKGDAVTGNAAALTQTKDDVYELSLATVAVSAGAVTISASNVSDARTFVGSRVGVWRTVARPASPRIGQIGYNIELGKHEYWTGSAWALLLDADSGWISRTATGGFEGSVRVRKIGPQVFLQMSMSYPSGLIPATPTNAFTIPADFAPGFVGARLALTGFPSTTAHSMLLDLPAGTTTARIARVGPTNGGVYYNGAAWMVD